MTNGWRAGVGYPGQPAAAVSTEVPAALAPTWRGLKEFVHARRVRTEQTAREIYHRQARSIAEQADAGQLSEKEERAALEKAQRARDEKLALAQTMWPSLDAMEAEARRKAKAAAEAAVLTVWRETVAQAEQHWPDWSYKAAVSYP